MTLGIIAKNSNRGTASRIARVLLLLAVAISLAGAKKSPQGKLKPIETLGTSRMTYPRTLKG